jgi:hypothetical protein
MNEPEELLPTLLWRDINSVAKIFVTIDIKYEHSDKRVEKIRG